MVLIEQLMQFGLTRQEATIYQTLYAEKELTGYETAKLTGISRSNVYTALAGLVDKGIAYMEEEGVTKYIPVKFEEFSRNYMHSLAFTRKAILQSLPKKQEKEEGYITIRGNKNIFYKIRNMLLETEYRVYMAFRMEILKLFEQEMKQLVKKGIKVVILVDEPYELPGAAIYYKSIIDCQIRLITDSHKVLTGQLNDCTESTCLYSQNQNLVDVFKQMLQNEITLLKLAPQEKQNLKDEC